MRLSDTIRASYRTRCTQCTCVCVSKTEELVRKYDMLSLRVELFSLGFFICSKFSYMSMFFFSSEK